MLKLAYICQEFITSVNKYHNNSSKHNKYFHDIHDLPGTMEIY